jgi:hypothetical protein
MSQSTFTVQCWGCYRSETHPYSGYEDSEAKIEEMKSRGWRRHKFGPGADPWFCCENCALNSYNSLQAKEWWDRKAYEEEQETAFIPDRMKGLLGIAAFAGILVLAALFSECIHATFQ